MKLSDFFFKEVLFIFGSAGSSLMHADFSLVVVSGSCSPVAVHRLLTVAVFLVREHKL